METLLCLNFFIAEPEAAVVTKGLSRPSARAEGHGSDYAIVDGGMPLTLANGGDPVIAKSLRIAIS